MKGYDFEAVERYKLALFEKLMVEMPDGSRQAYAPHKGQAPIHFTDYRFGWVRAGQRTGKTLPLSVEHTSVLGFPRTRSWLVAPTYDLVDRCFEGVWRWVVEEKVHGPDSINGARCNNTRDNRQITMKDGSFLRGKTAENPKSLVGEQLDFLGMDECRYFPETLWGDKLRPRLVNRQGRALGITSPGGFGWFSDFWYRGQSEEGKADGWFSVAYTLYDNPYVPREEIEEMRRSMTDQQFRQEVLGEFIHFTGRVWPQFRDLLVPEGHLYKPTDKPFGEDVSWWRGIDPGYRNPTACLWVAVDREGNLYVDQEYEEAKVPHEDHAKNITALTSGEVFLTLLPKDARKKNPLTKDDRFSVWDIYRNNGVFCRDAYTDVQAGLSHVARYLQAVDEEGSDHPALYINEECVKTRRAILEYVFEDPKTRLDVDSPDRPKKRNDHLCDVLRYICAAKPQHVPKALVRDRPRVVRPPRRRWAGAGRIA